MPWDVNGTIINNSGAGIGVTTNGYLGLNFDGSGIALQSRRAFFYAEGSTAGYKSFNTSSWNTMVFTAVVADNLGNYSTASGAFTAPISGAYYFMANSYVYKPSGSQTDYFHPIFQINGSFTSKQAIGNAAAYRLKGRTYSTGGYSAHGQINDIFYLTAGDYVNYVIYASNNQQWYDSYSMFCGVQMS